MFIEVVKLFCENCNSKLDSSTVLRAANPFDTKDEVLGCPKCKEVNNIRTTCDYPDCWAQDTIGTPTSAGYRRTCYKHQLKD